MQFHCSKKRPFLPFLDTKPPFAITILNNHDKQIRPSESWDQDCFLSPGLGYQHIQIIGLKFLQRCGHQIRVNSWTGSRGPNYTKKNCSMFEES